MATEALGFRGPNKYLARVLNIRTHNTPLNTAKAETSTSWTMNGRRGLQVDDTKKGSAKLTWTAEGREGPEVRLPGKAAHQGHEHGHEGVPQEVEGPDVVRRLLLWAGRALVNNS